MAATSSDRNECASKPKISVVIPVYNGAKYVRAAIESALSQDYQNIEILIVNDGSTDATDQIVQSFRDPRLRYFVKPNGGVATALNVGIANMTGEFFCWLSHDDCYVPEKITLQTSVYLSQYSAQNVILCSDWDLIDEAGKHIRPVRMNNAELLKKPEYAIFRGAVHGCTVFVPRRFFEEVGQFDPSLPGTQDYDLWSRGLAQWRFVHMPVPLVQSRWHSEQGSKTGDYRIESNAFWIRAMDSLPPQAKVRLEGSEAAFYAEMASFFSRAELHEPAAYARAKASQFETSNLGPPRWLAYIRAKLAQWLARM